MRIGYARTSTLDQAAGFEAQIAELENAGCEKIFREQVSAVGQRPELESAVEFVRQGDAFVVTKLCRLARDTKHLLSVAELLNQKGVALEILDIKLDTQTPTGRLMLTMLGAISSFEREMMIERQREGVAAAKRAGKYKGRKPTARAKTPEIVALHHKGVRPTEIARRLEIGRASVYRALADKKSAKTDSLAS